jgi:hypothetical protein
MADETTDGGRNSGPDFGLVEKADFRFRMADNGPRYKETPADPYAPDAPFVAEPWNAVTASFFVWIVLAWAVRLWGRYARFPFLTSCLPILLVGGVGGTLYHAFRTRRAYFYLDVVPISVLALAGAAYLSVRLWGRRGYLYLLLSLVGYIGFSGLFFLVLNPVFPTLRTVSVNATYAALAAVVVIPLGAALVRSRFRHAGLVAAAVASFGIAWFCRLVDGSGLTDLPMGTHWLWHTFGALTTGLLIEYFYRVEGEGRSPDG